MASRVTPPVVAVPVAVKPLDLWLVDRSRWETGREHCSRARYYGYHAGPHGYGWRRKAQSIPAVTGLLVHEPISLILTQVQAEDRVPSDAFLHAAIQTGVKKYHQIVETRGLRMTHAEQDLATKVLEQTTLLESLLWVWARVWLPAFLETWQVVLVESEELSVVDCTCGLGNLAGEAAVHDERGCAGVVWMTRGDAIAKSRTAPYRYSYHEVKTTGDANMNWEAQWPHRVQLMAGVLGAEQRLGVTIDEVYIVALLKGRNQAEWDPTEGKASGPRYQSTGLVYGGFRAANPPLLAEQWAAKWKGQYYVGDDGKRHKMTSDFPRTGIWTLGAEYWQAGGCQSPSDYWTRWMGLDQMAESLKVIGPVYRSQWKLEQFLQQLTAEERRYQAGLFALHIALETFEWGSPEVERLLDHHFPQSRGGHCHSFFGDTCEHLAVCNHEPGWQDPALMGMVPRRPHHQAELEQAIGRGLLAPEGLDDEREE